MYKIAAIPIPLVDVLWETIEPILQRVVDVAHDEINCESIRQRVLRGDVLLLVICKGEEIIAVNTAEVRIFDTGKRALYIPIVGGDELDGWMHQFLEVAKSIAIEYKCEELRGLAARRGWLKKLAPLGWKEAHTVVSFDIDLGE